MRTKGMPNTLARLLICLILALLIAVPAVSRAKDTHIEYCIASPLPDSVNDISRCQWAERSDLSTNQFLKPNKWIRIHTQDLLSEDNPLQNIQIHVSPHFIEHISLYRSRENGTFLEEAKAGSLVSGDNSHEIIGGYLFVTPSIPRASTFLLKIDTYLTGYVGISVEPWPTGGVQSQLGLGLHLGALVLILTYAVSSALINPNPLMWRFSLFLTCSTLSVLSGSGVLAYYSFDDKPELDALVFALITSVRMATWAWLCQAFLEPYDTNRWYKYACYLTYLISTICAVLSFGLRGDLIQPLLISGTALISIAQIFAIYKTPSIDRQYRRLLLISFTTIAAILLAMSITALLPVFPENMAIHIARITVILPILLIASLIIYQNRKTRDDLIAVRNELDAANTQRALMDKLHEERRMMMDMLTHELRNPLATISLATQSVTDQIKTINPEVERRIFKINQAVSNMDAVIERCNLANMANQEELRIDRSSFDVKSLLEDLIDVLPAPERVQLLLSPGVSTTLLSDPYLTQIVFANLLDNALKYSQKGSLVTVSISMPSKLCLRISVSNTLDAMLSPDPAKLFERFYRHPAAHRTSGTGLGLFLIRLLCKRLGGSINTQFLGDTLTFNVEVPK